MLVNIFLIFVTPSNYMYTMKLATHCSLFILVCATVYFSVIVVHSVLHKRMKIATPPNPINGILRNSKPTNYNIGILLK